MASLQQALAPVVKSLGFKVEPPKTNNIDEVPIPKMCRYCTSKVEFVFNDVIYGVLYGDWPRAYLCTNDDCGAYVGVHPNTEIPLGSLANYELREARKAAKNAFNPIWQKGSMTRTQAYHWLAKQLNIDVKTCHFAWFEVDRCKQAQQLCKQFAKR